jgi:hypothetical protein
MQPEIGGTSEVIRSNLDTILVELALRVFDMLPEATAVCLGLTCRRLYCCLKSTYSIPIRLDNFVNYDLDCNGIYACGQWACL